MKPTMLRRCTRCGRSFPKTAEFWYLYKSGFRRGQPTGYCRIGGCQNAYCRTYEHEIVRPEQLARRRLQQRDFQRRKEGYNPERYRVSVYEAMLAGEPTPRPAS